jgi:hypothetical protein
LENLLALLLIVSIGLNAWLYKLSRAKAKAPQPTVEASDMLRDILNGGATVQIKVLDSANLMMRSPRSGGWR